MLHPRDHEQAIELLGVGKGPRVISAPNGPHYVFEIVNAVGWRNIGIGKSVILNQLAASGAKRPKVRINRIEDSPQLVVNVFQIAFLPLSRRIFEFAEIPIGIFKSHIFHKRQTQP